MPYLLIRSDAVATHIDEVAVGGAKTPEGWDG